MIAALTYISIYIIRSVVSGLTLSDDLDYLDIVNSRVSPYILLQASVIIVAAGPPLKCHTNPTFTDAWNSYVNCKFGPLQTLLAAVLPWLNVV